MKAFNLKSLKSAAVAAIALGCVVSAPQAARADQPLSDWQYSIDSFNDGTEGRIIGDNSDFEFYGLAFREYEDTVVFAINSNLDQDTGWLYSGADGGSVHYGDLFINFGAGNFADSDGSSDMYAVNFADNDTGVQQGLYSDVTSESLTHRNVGYSSTQSHANAVARYGGTASYGDLAADSDYFDTSSAARTHMASGNYAGSIMAMDNFDDLDFSSLGAIGSNTFGFSIDKSLLPMGEFVAHFFAECGNDGVALAGEILGGVAEVPDDNDTASVPESSSMAGLLAVGMMAGGAALRKRRKTA